MFKRNLSLLPKIRNPFAGKSVKNDASEALSAANIPKSTGNGPFVEIPKFEAIGQPASILNVTLPASSRLNIRNGSIIAINGESNGLSSQLKNLSNVNPLIYQEIKSVSPVSILISGGLNQNFTVLDIEREENWVIANSKSIIAWSGYDFQLVPNTRQLVNGGGLFRLDNFTTINTSGKGQLVLSGKSELFDIQLGEGEELLLEPSCLVAHDSIHPARFDILKGDAFFKIPSFSWVSGLGIRIGSAYTHTKNFFKYVYVKLGGRVSPQIHKLESQKNTTNGAVQPYSTTSATTSETIISTLKNVTQFIATQISRVSRREVYYHVQGPGKLIISSSNGGISSRKTFSKQDLASIYDTLK